MAMMLVALKVVERVVKKAHHLVGASAESKVVLLAALCFDELDSKLDQLMVAQSVVDSATFLVGMSADSLDVQTVSVRAVLSAEK